MEQEVWFYYTTLDEKEMGPLPASKLIELWQKGQTVDAVDFVVLRSCWTIMFRVVELSSVV